jgi:hypothetical protein
MDKQQQAFKPTSSPPVGGYNVSYDQTQPRSIGGYIEPEAERIHMFADLPTS